jgi:hypothetical protein
MGRHCKKICRTIIIGTYSGVPAWSCHYQSHHGDNISRSCHYSHIMVTPSLSCHNSQIIVLAITSHIMVP